MRWLCLGLGRQRRAGHRMLRGWHRRLHGDGEEMTTASPRSRQVSEQIRAMILGGHLKPGERLVEDKLSAELGVSRVPVREALLALSAQGLVHIEPRRGATVAEITPKAVAELVEVRALLEGLNAKLA